MTAATMDDEVFREFRKIGLPEEIAAKMAALISDYEADAADRADFAAKGEATTDRASDRAAFSAEGKAETAPDRADFAKEREARIYRALYDDTSFREFLRNSVATFKVGAAEVKKMVTGKPWNGWVMYQSVMTSLLMAAMPALFVFMIYLWFAL